MAELGHLRYLSQCLQENDAARSAPPERPDLIGRDFSCPVPTAKLVGDTTYRRTTAGFIYLAVVDDLCTRMVVGWSLRDNMRAGLVVFALKMAYSRGYVAGGAIFYAAQAAST